MGEMRAPGLPATWLNAWLAALGVTVLVDDARLRWSNDGVPVAVLDIAAADDVAAIIAESLPSCDQLDAMAIARPRLERRVDLDSYRAASEVARRSRDFSLSSSATDLAGPDDSGHLPHAPLDPAVPRGETLWDRLKRCREALDGEWPRAELVRRSLEGRGMRVESNGLGFDFTRIKESGDKSAPRVDPVIECLAFYGLAFFPVRGNGRTVRPRGWRDTPIKLTWPTWSPYLDRWAIDALLGLAFREQITRWHRLGLGIDHAYESVRFRASSDDRTTGFASRRVL